MFQKPVLKTPPVAIAAVGEWAGRRDRDGGWHASWDDGAAALGQSYIGPLDMGMPLKQLLGTLYSVRLSRHCLCLAPPLVSWLKHCLWFAVPRPTPVRMERSCPAGRCPHHWPSALTISAHPPRASELYRRI